MPKRSSGICLKIPQRWVTVAMGFLGLLNVFAMRLCISLAITEMTVPHNNTILQKTNDSHVTTNDQNNTFTLAITEMTILHNNTMLQKTNNSYEVKNDQNNTFSNSSKHIRYDWSEHTQGLILSSFYWGYMFSSIFGGSICHKFGGKHTLGVSVLLTSIFTLLTPHSVYWGGSTGLIILRVLMGFGEGTSFPAVIHLLAQWIPVNERSIAGSLAFSGTSMGVIVGMFVSGMILHHSDMGWPMVFYVYGTIGIVSFLLNAAFCYDRPSENPYISDEELTYLRDKLVKTQTNLPSTPWRYILTSPSVYASIIAKFGFAWGITTIVSDFPKYMKNVLNFSVLENGYLSATPHAMKMIFSYFGSWIIDTVIRRKIISITIARKIGTTLSLTGTAVFLVAATFAGRNTVLVVGLQFIGITLLGSAYFSVLINALDLSPNYASHIMGLGNGIAVVSGALSPYIVGVLAPNQTMEEWHLVFWLMAAIFVASNLVYLVYGSGEVQEWNDPAFLNKTIDVNEDEVKDDVELMALNKTSNI